MKLSMSVFATSQQQRMDCCSVGYGCLILHQITLQMAASGHKRVRTYTCILVYVTLKSTRIKIWAKGKPRFKSMTKYFCLLFQIIEKSW